MKRLALSLLVLTLFSACGDPATGSAGRSLDAIGGIGNPAATESLSVEELLAGLVPDTTRVRSDLNHWVGRDSGTVSLAPSSPITFQLVAQPPYLISGGQVIPLDGTITISSLSNGDIAYIPFQFVYRDAVTTVEGVITYQFVYVSASTSFVESAIPFVIETVQQNRAWLVGTVRNRLLDLLDGVLNNDSPFANALVAIDNLDTGTVQGVTRTATNGTWSLPVTGGHRYRIRASAAGWAETLLEVWVAPGGVVSGLNQGLMPLPTSVTGVAQIIGTVVDGNGTPATGTTMALVSADSYAIVRQVPSLVANTDGQFVLTGIGAGTYRVMAQLGALTAYSAPITVSLVQAQHADTLRVTMTIANHPPIVSCPADVTGAVGDIIRMTPTVSDPDGDTLLYTVSVHGGLGLLAHEAWQPYADVVIASSSTGTVTFAVSDGAFSRSCNVAVNSSLAQSSPGYTLPALTWQAPPTNLVDFFDDTNFSSWIVAGEPTGFSHLETGTTLTLDSGLHATGTTAANSFYGRQIVSQNGGFSFEVNFRFDTSVTGDAMFVLGRANENQGIFGGVVYNRGAPYLLLMNMISGVPVGMVTAPVTLDLGWQTYTLAMLYDASTGTLELQMPQAAIVLDLSGVALDGTTLPFLMTSIGGIDNSPTGVDSRMKVEIDYLTSDLMEKQNQYASTFSPWTDGNTLYNRVPGVAQDSIVAITVGKYFAITQDGMPVEADGVTNLNVALVTWMDGTKGTVITDLSQSSLLADALVSAIDYWIPNYYTGQGAGLDYLVP